MLDLFLCKHVHMHLFSISIFFYSCRNSHVESYTNWLKFSRCKRQLSYNMANDILSSRGNDAKMMESLCKGLDNLIKMCSHKILNKCFDVEMIHQINAALLDRMMPAIDNLKVCQSYFMYYFLF